jgi:hypothetical protein
LTPKPATTRSPDLSSRMPASFASPNIKSLGHLSDSAALGTAASTASISASPAASASAGAGGSEGRSWTMVEPKKLPSMVSHARPCRPRPLSCSRATSQSPSMAWVSPSSALLVDPIRSTMRIRLRTGFPPRSASNG